MMGSKMARWPPDTEFDDRTMKATVWLTDEDGGGHEVEIGFRWSDGNREPTEPFPDVEEHLMEVCYET